MAGKDIVINIGGLVYVIDESVETMKLLFNPVVMTTTGITLHDSETNANYQVPGATTFTMLGALFSTGITPHTIKIFENDTADSNATLAEKHTHFGIDDALDKDFLHWVPFYYLPTIAANKFVNTQISNVANSSTTICVIGFET